MLSKSFGKYWFWVSFPIGLLLAFTVHVLIGILAFWILSIAPHLIYFIYRRWTRGSQS